MAVVVRVSCVDCGDQQVGIGDVQLFTTANVAESRFGFTCPQCLSWINRPAGPNVVAMLREVCVRERRRVPREVFEQHRGPALTVDDALDFALELRHVDELARYACRR